VPAALLTIEARRYAIGEIIKRAGVSPEWSKTWRIEIDDESAAIHLDSAGRKKVVFPVLPAPGAAPETVVSGGVARPAWTFPPPANLRALVPDFIVPFVGSGHRGDGTPVYSATDPDTIQFNFDLPAAALFTLARFEETVIGDRDSHGRFPASASIAVKENFLHRPIVDEYGFAF